MGPWHETCVENDRNDAREHVPDTLLASVSAEQRGVLAPVAVKIANTPARTPLGLAVQLRRVQAAIEHDDRELATHLVARAVVSCERMVVAG